jgi:hypothetical protein
MTYVRKILTPLLKAEDFFGGRFCSGCGGEIFFFFFISDTCPIIELTTAGLLKQAK